MVLCARCNKPAYHVEQVVGPAGKVYHKACLKCLSCGKRLDSHLLVEHDDEPYCKNCHLQNFGTRDLRHFNHPTMPSPSSAHAPSSPVAASSAAAAPPKPQSYLHRPPVPPKPTFGGSARAIPPALPARSEEKLVIEPVRERSAASLAVMGGSPRNGARFGAASGSTPGAKAGWRVEGDTEKCPGCGKTVYHAEQVVALDRKWHKGCLRCSNCSATLVPGKVQDHRGQVLCAKCHVERTGGGYAMR